MIYSSRNSRSRELLPAPILHSGVIHNELMQRLNVMGKCQICIKIVSTVIMIYDFVSLHRFNVSINIYDKKHSGMRRKKNR